MVKSIFTSEKKYGVLGIEIKVLPNVNQVIHNEDNLTLNDANRVTRRAKLIVENNNDEILICHMGVKYFLIGGHIDNDESDEQCLTREVAEESGVTLNFSNILPIASSNYINKDYPKNGDITYTNTNYYAIKYDLVPNIEMQNLTEEEIDELLRVSRDYFQNKNYNVYFTNTEFEYNGQRRKVESNDYMVAVKI